jgi:hypothetical protein
MTTCCCALGRILHLDPKTQLASEHSMNNARILLLALLVVTGLEPQAHAHAWYPKECCSDHDCVPADAIVTDERGGKIVVIGLTRIPIADDFTARSSPDGRVHICFRTTAGEQYGGPSFVPLCLFLPAQS